ncbi:MAG TPA: NAD(P)H-hydrate epimerase [Candidatus Nitrosocosmicus sp.]|jgi:NAD(P)H-hydrate epimerase|uniref:NAD(P)H-hydrate epimerase n=1 Tax=Candidatus Nitrosocosmicus agrestis TaxID=2563600 RepID=UPI00122DEE6F|nr:NAD(P)H-hydrate epimerase [Candidatus Nitrosocosmicus sp. SS]KAA2282001.1 NAD(P)H-hydrate epimerase [Candidatus Nitrosocosmicus sp. SS]KAF0869906.1 NAD(P)H-hydrate epimerase [Candidatus Nitrosocosmicus sp. SS]MDR4490702.1 NAD(P)H-hydrate epimerase [Candidatus Nitrosocosmicus sp.]HET6590805.1 NAD(P)H-hydrate epimerase [Candidatus Nitrosocosmicus sp.]
MEIKDSHVPKGFTAITSEQMYRIENNGETVCSMNKILMMENAGSRVADFLISEFGNDITTKSIVAICGKGNNGGDAMVAIRHLQGYMFSMIDIGPNSSLTVILLCNPTDLKTTEAKSNWDIIERMKSINTLVYNQDNINEIEKKIEESHIILDGILGTGIKGKMREPYSMVIECINKNKGKAFIVAIDFPSGTDPDTGLLAEKSVMADVTITFHRLKSGHSIGSKSPGRLIVDKIGIPYEAERGVIQE